MSDLGGRIALVTGGSRGIGAATALEFAERGAQVVVVYRSKPDEAAAVVEGLPGSGHRAAQCDVSSTGNLIRLREDVAGKEGFVSYLINNAGWSATVPHLDLDALTDEIIERTFSVNTFGLLKACRELAPLLRADKPGGAIVNVSSVAARNGMGSSIAYCASKLAVESITQTLARVFGPEIRVMAVAPGLTATAMTSGWSDEQNARRVQSNAMKRMADPSEIAKAIVHTAADLTYSTGSTVMAEGGRTLYGGFSFYSGEETRQ